MSFEVLRPPPAVGHVSVSFKNFVLVWGGYTMESDETGDYPDYVPGEFLFAFNSELDIWTCIETKETVPPGTSGAASVLVDNWLYIVGGHSEFGYSNETYKLDLISKEWAFMPVRKKRSFSPRDKSTCWEYENRLYIFGGFGLPLLGYLKDHETFVADDSTPDLFRGWNNQLLCMDLNTDTHRWTNVPSTGCVPSARAAHSTVLVGHHLYLFGGRHSNQRLNDLYCLDMNSLQWTRVQVQGVEPEGRSWHSWTPCTSTDFLLYGGFSQSEQVLGDCWVFNTERLSWTKHAGPAQASPRLWHSACKLGTGDVAVFGGCCNNILARTVPNQLSDELHIIRWSPSSLFRLALDASFNYRSQLQDQWSLLPQSICQLLQAKLKYMETLNER